jgi:hypothetical protein
MNDKYDIAMEEYFSLPESIKKDITNDVVDDIFVSIKQEPRLLYQYIFMLDTQIEQALDREIFEHADIVLRIKNKLLKTYNTI